MTRTELIGAAIAGDPTAVRRLARERRGPIAASLAEVALHATSVKVVNLAIAALGRRKTDPAAISALQRVLCNPPQHTRDAGWHEVAAIMLAERKERRAVSAAIASYPAMRAGSRERLFLIQTLANRTERERDLRANRALADLLLDVARGDDEERADAVWGLWKIAAPRTIPGLVALLDHDDAYVQEIAATALIRIGRADAIAAVTTFVERCTKPKLAAIVRAELGAKRRKR